MNVFKRMKSDKGASNTVSFIVIIAFIMTMLVSFIDVGLYFNTKNQMQTAADNGARSVAMYGGNDTDVRSLRGGSTSPEQLVRISIPEAYKNPTENKTVVLKKVKCDVESSKPGNKITAGDHVYCDVTYTYNGIAGGFGLFNLGRKKDGTSKKDIVIRGSSVSEVTIKN